jgi:endonuclease/exonuclease/phosphatase family metal-dependent hydrolase
MNKWFVTKTSTCPTRPRPLFAASRFTQPLLAAAFLTLAIALLGPGSARADDRDDDDRAVRVMTYNVDEGTDFQELTAAKTFPQFLAAVTTTYQNILATKPAERAAAMAREIARQRTDVVGLQEASILRTGAHGSPATTVRADLLQLLISELAKLGQHYAVVAIVPGLDAQAPSLLGFDVRLTTQDAIIARTDIDILTIHIQVQHFATLLTVPTAIGPITIPRGWAALDAVIRGQALRFVTTHLDPNSPPVQLAQAKELLQTAGDTLLPVVFAGDFNATADDPSNPTFASYQTIIDGGFQDVWKLEHRHKPGFTCCQDPNLLNAKSALNHRSDLILLRGRTGVDDVKLVGDHQADRTPSGLWPSDHAGVVATLKRDRGDEGNREVAGNR